MPDYIVAGCKPWNRRVFDASICKFPGQWHYVSTPDELKRTAGEVAARYVFFLHWSWIVPDSIVRAHSCVLFHMTDVPYGRGGSPLQNLVLRGHTSTVVTAMRMTTQLDAGPVYAKRELSLCGSAEEIYQRATELSAELILWMISEHPKPIPQEGTPTFFVRRGPANSRIPPFDSLRELGDFIRMLDAETYPPAFIEHNGFRYEFHQLVLYSDCLRANVTIRKIGDAP